jgi:hypothetical protein
MADLVFVVVTIGIFGLFAALVVGCDRIVRADQDDRPAAVTSPVDAPEEVAA